MNGDEAMFLCDYRSLFQKLYNVHAKNRDASRRHLGNLFSLSMMILAGKAY